MNESVVIKKIALVTGASRGIGAAIAVEMARQGFFVVGTATTPRAQKLSVKCFSSINWKGLDYQWM